MNKPKKKKVLRFKGKAPVSTKENTIKSDVDGSYTGVPQDKNEKPVQDADDL